MIFDTAVRTAEGSRIGTPSFHDAKTLQKRSVLTLMKQFWSDRNKRQGQLLHSLGTPLSVKRVKRFAE